MSYANEGIVLFELLQNTNKQTITVWFPKSRIVNPFEIVDEIESRA